MPEDIPILPKKLPLPKFLIADDLDSDRVFVIHTGEPHFIVEVVLAYGGETMLDPHSFNADDELSNHALRGILLEAAEFYKRSKEPHREQDDSSQRN